MKKTSRKKKPRKTLLWAVDPFSRHPATAAVAREALFCFSKAMDAAIEPVFVLGPDETRIPETLFAQWRSEYAAHAMEKLGEHTHHPEQLPARLLVQKGGSMTSKADALVAYARREKSPLIGLTTSARTGVDRFLVGSFAETLMLRSRVPMLIVKPGTVIQPTFKRVLFATDLGPASKVAFAQFLASARSLGAELLIYSRCDLLLSEGAPALGLEPSLAEHLTPDLESRRKTGEKWKAMAEKAGLTTRLVLDTRAVPTVEGILSTATDHQVDLIAMAARSGKIVAAVLGSIARMVVRQSEVPVWVVHTR